MRLRLILLIAFWIYGNLLFSQNLIPFTIENGIDKSHYSLKLVNGQEQPEYFQKLKYGFKDSTGKIVIKPKFDLVRPFREQISIVVIDGNYGVIDNNGYYLVKPMYKRIDDFKEGLAVTVYKENNSLTYHYGYIDRNGTVKIEFIYDKACSFKNGVAIVQKNISYNIINKEGKTFFDWKKYDYISENYDELITVMKWNKYGFIDTHGNEIIELIYDYASDFSNGIALINKENKYGFIKLDGSYLIEPVLDYATPFTCNYNIVSQKGKYGLLNIDGSYSIELVLDTIFPFYNNIALYRKENKFGFIDTTGNYLFWKEYDGAASFCNGIAKVKDGQKYYFINRSGIRINDYEFEDASAFLFCNAVVKKDNQYFLMDSIGNLIQFQRDYTLTNIDIPPIVHYNKEKITINQYLSIITNIGEYRNEDIDIADTARVKLIIDATGNLEKYEVLSYLNYKKIDDNIVKVLTQFPQNNTAAIKDGVHVRVECIYACYLKPSFDNSFYSFKSRIEKICNIP